MVQKKDTKFFKQYGYLFYKNLISKAEIRKCLKSAKYMQKEKIMMNKVYKYYENHIKKKNKQILVRIENFYKKDINFTKLINNKDIQKILKYLFNEKQ